MQAVDVTANQIAAVLWIAQAARLALSNGQLRNQNRPKRVQKHVETVA